MTKTAFDLESIKIVIRFVDKDFSRYTMFIPFFKFSKVFLKLEEKFSLYLKLNHNSILYEVPQIANCIVNLLCCGIDRFVRIDDEFRIEKALAKSLGFSKGFPTSSTFYRFFQKINGYNLRQIQRVNLEILKEQKQKWYPATGTLFMDLDMNTKSVEGKQIEKAALGYNRKKPGRLCLNWTVGHISRVALFSELHSGKTSGKTILQQQVQKIERLLTKVDIDPAEERIVWRVDGGYFSYKNLEYMYRRKFIIRLPKNLTALKPHLEDTNCKWHKYGRYGEYRDAGKVYFEEIGKEGRLVIVRVHRKNKILIYPLCTNIFDWKARSVVKGYRGRQKVENYFRDTNQAFYADKLPSGTYGGNAAFLWFVCIAYNAFFFFQRGIRGKKNR